MANGQYDFAFSLGQACTCSLTLRAANLQFASFPLDWVAEGTILSRAGLVASRFAGWLEKDDFEYKGRNPKNGMGMFTNTRTGLRHPHDFSDGPIEASYGEAREKYRRREARFLDMMTRSRRVLVVYVTRPDEIPAQLDDVVKARNILAEAFPDSTFDLIRFMHRQGLDFADRIVDSPAPHITEIVFDYRHPVSDVNPQKTAQALMDFGITVTDYRTDKEKAAYALKVEQDTAKRKRAAARKRKMDKYGTSSTLGLMWARLRSHVAKMFSGR